MAERAWVQMARTMTAAPPPVPIPEKPRGLLALDIDGTLLGPGGVLSERTREAVYAAGEAGWLVTLARPVSDSGPGRCSTRVSRISSAWRSGAITSVTYT